MNSTNSTVTANTVAVAPKYTVSQVLAGFTFNNTITDMYQGSKVLSQSFTAPEQVRKRFMLAHMMIEKAGGSIIENNKEYTTTIGKGGKKLILENPVFDLSGIDLDLESFEDNIDSVNEYKSDYQAKKALNTNWNSIPDNAKPF